VTRTPKNGFPPARPAIGWLASDTVRRVVRRVPNEYVQLARPPHATAAACLCEEPARWSAGDDTEGVA